MHPDSCAVERIMRMTEEEFELHQRVMMRAGEAAGLERAAKDLRDLGALAAEHVLGWQVCRDESCEGCDRLVFYLGDGGWAVGSGGCNSGDDCQFIRLAEDIGDAWGLVDKLAEQRLFLELSLASDSARANFRREGPPEWSRTPEETAPTVPAAIALAALAAVGHPVRLELGAGEET